LRSIFGKYKTSLLWGLTVPFCALVAGFGCMCVDRGVKVPNLRLFRSRS
jgi:hypothetical protein